jgi:hypothetical protein
MQHAAAQLRWRLYTLVPVLMIALGYGFTQVVGGCRWLSEPNRKFLLPAK